MSTLYCGTCGWNYRHWRSLFYPEDLPQDRWLSHYATHFDTVEINNSFYRLPDYKTFENWSRRTPDHFLFAVKASRYLTHVKKLSEPNEPLDRLLHNSSGLGSKRGPILYQFPPGWTIDLERLAHFLKLLPSDVRHVFEFRNDSWHNEKVWSLLSNHSAAYCMMDAPGLPLHIRTTADFAYIRMHSGGEQTRGCYTTSQLSEWARRIEGLLGRGDVYVYFNNDAFGFAVANAQELSRLLMGS